MDRRCAAGISLEIAADPPFGTLVELRMLLLNKLQGENRYLVESRDTCYPGFVAKPARQGFRKCRDFITISDNEVSKQA